MNEMFSQGGKGSTGILTNKQAIARKFDVKQNEVVYFAVGVDLGGYKVIYDKTTQRAYSLPVLPAGTTAVSLNEHAVLVHSAGTVDLGELAATRREFVCLSDSFVTDLVVNTRNELLFHNNIGYTYLGALPVTIAEGTNPVGNADWKPQSYKDLEQSLAEDDGFKLIGKCPDVSTLRTIEPDNNNQRIFVVAHTSGVTVGASGDSGGGWFYADLSDSTSNDDNGVVIVTSGGKRWKRDLSNVRGITPKMFGAWMDAPYIDGTTIQGTPYPKAPSMGAADLSATHNDGAAMLAAYTASISHNIPLLIEQPIYIGSTQIDISAYRWDGVMLNIIGDSPRKSIIYTSTTGGFVSTSWGHNLSVENIAFRNADADYVGCPLMISGSELSGGGGKLYTIRNVEFYHYKFALPTLTFVSTIENIYMYDCKYGLALSGSTSTNINSVWAHHCDDGFLWGYSINRSTYEPVAGGYPVMYVTASNIAADGCIRPHRVGGQLRSVTIDGMGIEGINGTVGIDFSDYSETDDQFKFTIKGLSCWIQGSMNTGVTRFIEMPTSEARMPNGSIVLESGYVKADYQINLINKNTSGNVEAYGNSLVLGDNFRFVKATDNSRSSDTRVRSIKSGNRVYGHAPLEGRNSYDGVTLSSINVTADAYFNEVKTETATFILPWNRAVDILLTTVGEESKYGACFLAGEMSIIPVNKNGLSGTEAGGRIMFSISGSSQANVASGALWSNIDAGDKSLSGFNVQKLVTGGQTFIRVSCPSASISMAIVHMTLTYSGFAHYYDRRWQIRTI